MSCSADDSSRAAAAGAALAPCSPYANCVSTESGRDTQRMPAIAYADSPADAQRRVVAALREEPRTRIVEERAGYVRAESRSRIFRFTDDVEVVIDGDRRIIRFRSGARLGRDDMGVNRRRMERFTARVAQVDDPTPPKAPPPPPPIPARA